MDFCTELSKSASADKWQGTYVPPELQHVTGDLHAKKYNPRKCEDWAYGNLIYSVTYGTVLPKRVQENVEANAPVATDPLLQHYTHSKASLLHFIARKRLSIDDIKVPPTESH